MQQAPARYDLVLVGGGHTHALTLRMFIMAPPPETRLTLVSPEPLTPYSGMLPGLIAGHYGVEDTHIDLIRLCQASGARFVRQRVVELDADANRLRLADRTELDYDWLSLDVGSTPDLDSVPGAREHAIAVKPVSRFHARWRTFLDRIGSRGPGEPPPRLVVIGGGAGGTEIILAMAHALARRGLDAQLHLVTGEGLLPGYPPLVRRALRRALESYGVTLHSDQRVLQVEPSRVRTISQELPFDGLFWCTGARGAQWLAESSLATSDLDFVEVDGHLRSLSHQNVFAAGDCAWQVARPAARAGVYAVRQAPVLAHNLRASASGDALRRYRPQRKFLSLLAGGGRTAAGTRDPFSFRGDWVWRWKDRIDRRFMARFDSLPARPPSPAAAPVSGPRCAGCGAKVGSGALRAALGGLRTLQQEDVLAGLEAREDASVVRWPAGALLVQSQDYFPAFVDEPYLFGRIAALHSLSDIHARNARPHSALATVSLPVNHPRLQARDLGRLMQGAVRELNQAGCALLGGHTVEGPQMAAGFTVNGAGTPETMLGKGGGRPGDVLVLTKPLGTGVLLAAMMQGHRVGLDLDEALAWMLRSNGPAAAVLQVAGARAMTDVTGFGLLGHLLEMCEAGTVSAEVEAEAVPVLRGVLSLAARGVASTLREANDLALVRCQLPARLAGHPLLVALTDPQTSGGLLAAVPAERAPECVARLRSVAGSAWTIGRLGEPREQMVTLM